MASVIDIHPHIVSPDTKRYPLAPLGGKQSAWSSERPTTYDMLLEAMDRFPKVTMILDHLSRVPFMDGPPYAAAEEYLQLAKYQQVFVKITPINVSPESWGKATPATFFGKVIGAFGASRIAWGSNFP